MEAPVGKSVNPNPKKSILASFIEREKKPLTYEAFNLETYKEFRLRMENFRRPMEAIWESISRTYLPERVAELSVSAEWVLDTDGNAVPQRLFADSSESDKVEMREPLVAIKIHTGLSILTARTPDVVWDSDNETYDAKAPVLDALRKGDWRDEQTRAQYVMLHFYNFMYGTTYWRRYFEHASRKVFFASAVDPLNGDVQYKEDTLTEINQTVGEALSPLEVWIDPSTVANKPRSMRYCRYDKVYDYAKFRTLFDPIARAKDIEAVIPSTVDGHEGDDLVRCEYFEHIDLDLYYVVANDKPIYKGRLPQNHKGLSLRMATWFPRGEKSPFGLGPVEMMLPDKDVHDRLLSMTLSQIKFSIFKSMFYQGSLEVEGGEGGDIKLDPSRAYKVSNPESIKFLEVPGPGADSWRAIDTQRARIDDASGINQPLAGQITKSTALEVDLAKDAALARLGVPINSVLGLLQWDAETIFELQKQYYTLPEIKELVDPDEIMAALAELDAVKAKHAADPSSPAPRSDIWFDESDAANPRVFKGDYRVEQITMQETSEGSAAKSFGKQEVVVTPDVFDWKGKLYVVADSILSITPTLERTKKLEGYNILIPMFAKDPALVAKPARSIAKLYGLSVDDTFPVSWIAYLAAVDRGETPAPTLPMNAGPGRPANPAGGVEDALDGGFEQERADRVVTNIGGQRDGNAAASQAMNRGGVGVPGGGGT